MYYAKKLDVHSPGIIQKNFSALWEKLNYRVRSLNLPSTLISALSDGLHFLMTFRSIKLKICYFLGDIFTTMRDNERILYFSARSFRDL